MEIRTFRHGLSNLVGIAQPRIGYSELQPESPNSHRVLSYHASLLLSHFRPPAPVTSPVQMRACVHHVHGQRTMARENAQDEGSWREQWRVAPRQGRPFLPCWDQLPGSGLWGSLPPASPPGLHRATPLCPPGRAGLCCVHQVSHSNSPEGARPQSPTFSGSWGGARAGSRGAPH